MKFIYRKEGIVSLLIVLVLISSGCLMFGLRCEPEVVESQEDYYNDVSSLDYESSHERFAENYDAGDLSKEVRNKIITDMREQCEELGEDPVLLKESIKAVYGRGWDDRPMRIPCYAEKAYYNGTRVWSIAFNRANGVEGGIDHYDIYFVSLNKVEEIYDSGEQYTSENDPVLAHFGCK